MTRQEMIEMAKETRRQVMNAEVSEELLRSLPAEIREISVPTPVGETKIFDVLPEGGQKNDRLVINLHGGGFIRTRTKNDEVFCRAMAGRLKSRFLDVDYRIAPDDPFPAALEESYGVLQWAFARAHDLGISPQKIVLTGFSAGGNLAAGMTLLSVRRHTSLPSLLILGYPPMDLWTDPGDKKTMGKGIPAERARLYNLYYCDREMQKDPLASPVYTEPGELINFPPALIMTAGHDDLCNEAEEFALKLARAGVETTLRRFTESGHGFIIYRKEQYREAWDMISEFIVSHVSAVPAKDGPAAAV